MIYKTISPDLVKGKIGILPIVIKKLITEDRGRANWPFIVYGTIIQCLREIRREEVLI